MTTIRRYAAAALAAAALALVPAAPAAAHRGVLPTLHHDGRGAVWVNLAWDDGHPVGEPAVATLTGFSDLGGALAPTPLRPLPHDPATLTLPGTLAAGAWTVTLDVATPGLGYCAADLRVTAAGEPQTFDCRATAAAPTAAATAAPAAGAGRTVVIAAVLGLFLLVFVLVLLARRRTTARGRPRRRLR